MRIAVASDDGITIAGHFGRCAGFDIFEVTGNEVTKIENRPNTNSQHHLHHDEGDCGEHGHHEHHGAVHSHESFLSALHDCDAVICRGMGRRAVYDLSARGIKPVITGQDVQIDEAVRLYARGQLDSSSESQCCSH